MVGAGEPVALAAGEPVSVHANFTVAALTSSIPWPDTPTPSNQAYLSTACIKRADNTVLLGDSIRSYGYIHANMVVSTVNQIIVNDKAGTVQVGVCIKSDHTNGVILGYVGGTWFTLN